MALSCAGCTLGAPDCARAADGFRLRSLHSDHFTALRSDTTATTIATVHNTVHKFNHRLLPCQAHPHNTERASCTLPTIYPPPLND